MTPAALADLVRCTADDVLATRGIDPTVLPTTVTVERPRRREHGDYATNVALRTSGVPAREFARWLADALAAHPVVHAADVADPGFVNLRLTTEARADVVRQVLAAGDRFGVETATGTTPGTTADSAVRAPLVPGWPENGSDGRYAVQFTHARLAALARQGADLGVVAEGATLGLLSHQREAELLRALAEFPQVVACSDARRLARHLRALTEAVDRFTDACRVLPMGDEEPGPRHAARLALCHAARQVLANGLRLLGTAAPERM